MESTDLLCGQEAGKCRWGREQQGLRAHLRDNGTLRPGQKERGVRVGDLEDPGLGWAP